MKSGRMRWAGNVARMGEERELYKILVGKPEGKWPLLRPRRRWEDRIRMHLREICWEEVEWIQLAQDSVSGELLWMRWWNIGVWRQAVSYILLYIVLSTFHHLPMIMKINSRCSWTKQTSETFQSYIHTGSQTSQNIFLTYETPFWISQDSSQLSAPGNLKPQHCFKHKYLNNATTETKPNPRQRYQELRLHVHKTVLWHYICLTWTPSARLVHT
jgi:hypothetical protein